MGWLATHYTGRDGTRTVENNPELGEDLQLMAAWLYEQCPRSVHVNHRHPVGLLSLADISQSELAYSSSGSCLHPWWRKSPQAVPRGCNPEIEPRRATHERVCFRTAEQRLSKKPTDMACLANIGGGHTHTVDQPRAN